MSSDTQSNNKRIAKNTLFLYFRMLFLMFIAFFTSRIVLDSLGVVDFGINNVVGGLATMFVFFRSSLANVTQRYLNVEIGRNDSKRAQIVFAQHLSVYVVIAFIVVALAETIGLWIVQNKLVIPPERMNAAVWTFHCTVLAMAVTIVSVVFDAVIIAHENMKIYSYVGIVEGIAKLLLAYLLYIISSDKLIVYAVMLNFIAIGIPVFYYFYCKGKYEECVCRFMWDKREVKDAASMIGWNTLGTLIYAFNDQGVNMLLNLFFGPVVNAARGVTMQISNAVNNFSSNFFTSVRPQIVKSYAQQDWNYLYQLFFASSKYSYMLMWVICLPLMLRVDSILSVWLKEVPEYAGVFTIWILIYSLINTLNTPVWTLALAVGELKQYILVGSGVFFLVFPISAICLYCGCSPVSVFICMVLVRVVYIAVVLRVIHTYIKFDQTDYYRKVILPCVWVSIASLVPALLISEFLPQTFFSTLLTIMVVTFINITVLWIIGLDKSEKTKLKQMVHDKMHKI